MPLRAEVPQLDAGSNLMLKSPDMQFAMRLSLSATGAAALGQSAGDKSQNPEVQSLAREIVGCSTKIRSELEATVKPMLVTLPDAIPANELSTCTKLRNLPAQRIDHPYLKAEVKRLKRNLKIVKAEIKKGKNPAIQHCAIDALPMLEANFERTESLYRTVPKK